MKSPGGYCPNCKQIDAIERQTKLQEKQFKMQRKAMAGDGGGGGGGIFAAIINGFFGLFVIVLNVSVQITLKIFEAGLGLMNEAKERNPEKFWKYVKWSAIIFFGSAFALAILKAVLDIIQK